MKGEALCTGPASPPLISWAVLLRVLRLGEHGGVEDAAVAADDQVLAGAAVLEPTRIDGDPDRATVVLVELVFRVGGLDEWLTAGLPVSLIS